MGERIYICVCVCMYVCMYAYIKFYGSSKMYQQGWLQYWSVIDIYDKLLHPSATNKTIPLDYKWVLPFTIEHKALMFYEVVRREKVVCATDAILVLFVAIYSCQYKLKMRFCWIFGLKFDCCASYLSWSGNFSVLFLFLFVWGIWCQY